MPRMLKKMTVGAPSTRISSMEKINQGNAKHLRAKSAEIVLMLYFKRKKDNIINNKNSTELIS